MKSLLTYIVLSLVMIVFSFTYYPKYKQSGGEATISWDVSGYYWYLPSLFIYKDLKQLTFSDSLRQKYACSPDNQQITFLPDGGKVLKYSSGMACQYLPFFAVAHMLAKPLGYEQDGFSTPYQLSVHIGALCMLLIGLWFLRKILLLYFEDATVAWTLFFLILGTNYLNYAAIDVGMSHAWLFTWYCILIYGTNQFYQKPNFKWAIFIGFICGLMALTRPTELLALIFPLGWGLTSIGWKPIKERFVFFIQQWKLVAFAGMAMVLVGSIQLLYWKYATGSWLVYSYGGQEFSWKHPHFADYLFSFRCGWLIYTPLMILPFLGIPFIVKRKIQTVPILLFILCYTWTVCAWDIWWYGGRAMIQGYVAYLFLLAALIEFVRSNRWARLIFFSIAFFFSYLNIWWLHGCHNGGYVYVNDMTEAYYKKVVGHFSIQDEDRRFLDTYEEYKGLNNEGVILLKDTSLLDSNKTPLHFVPKVAQDWKYRMAAKTLANKKWIRWTLNMVCRKLNWDSGRMTVMSIRFINGDHLVKENRILLDRLFYQQQQHTISLDAKLPKDDFSEVELVLSQSTEAEAEFEFESMNLFLFPK